MLADNSEKVVVSYAYDSWGKLLGIEGELKDTLGVKNPYRYKGYRYDNETGLYYLKSRYYNPELGRFISADAVVGKTGEILSHNLFSYCANNPVNAIDEDGNRFEWIKSKWNSFKKAVVTGVRKVVAGVKRIAARVVSGVKKAVRAASTWVRNKYRGYTNTARNTYRRTKKWVHNTARTISRKVRNTAHSVVKHTRSFVKNHRRAIEITRNVVAIASIALIAIPLVAPVAIPAMAIAALGIAEVGLDLAVGNNTSAAVGLLFLFPMGKGFKYVTEIGGDAIKGGSKAKNLYKLASKEWIESESIISIKALKHIFHGNTNWKGLPSGYHKASIMSKAKISNVSNPDKFGVYKATVEMKGKTKFSTFFPDSWSRVDVINSIKEAYRGIKLDKAGWYIGKTSSGMEIKMWLNDKGLVNTAFPIYSK